MFNVPTYLPIPYVNFFIHFHNFYLLIKIMLALQYIFQIWVYFICGHKSCIVAKTNMSNCFLSNLTYFVAPTWLLNGVFAFLYYSFSLCYITLTVCVYKAFSEVYYVTYPLYQLCGCVMHVLLSVLYKKGPRKKEHIALNLNH